MSTCLIVEVQLSPADLNDLRVIHAEIKLLLNKTTDPPKDYKPFQPAFFQTVLIDLESIIFQCKIARNKFNCYLFVKLITDLRYILSDIQLETDQNALDAYYELKGHLDKLTKLRDKLINPFS